MEITESHSTLSQFTVSDFVQWHREKRLILNPNFQRRSVWTPDGRSYLIDTILRGFPMPKIYLRTQVDTTTQVAVRDVVDGQQRLRAILDFASNSLVLNRRSDEFQGKRYSDLPVEMQQTFLGYLIGVEHLTNASDNLVLEAFSRLNSYTVALTGAEKRHAAHQGEFKWRVVELSNDLRPFLTKYNILTTRRMLRMEDDAFFAELIHIILGGVNDGGSAALDSLYRTYKDEFPDADKVIDIVNEVVSWMDVNLEPVLATTALSRAHQVQMLFAAVAHQIFGIPEGRLDELPARRGVSSLDHVRHRLVMLAEAVEDDDIRGDYGAFVQASSGATTRMASRGVRFRVFSSALTDAW